MSTRPLADDLSRWAAFSHRCPVSHSNITFVNVSSVENHGSGFSIWVKNLQDNPLPISITMRNCSNLRDHISGINIGSVANPGREKNAGATSDRKQSQTQSLTRRSEA